MVVAAVVGLPTPPLSASWAVSTGCNVVKADAKVFIKGVTTPKFVKATSDYANAIFDPTFNVLIDFTTAASPAIKTLGAADYAASAVTNSGSLEANTRLWVSGDSKTILLLTWSAGFSFSLRFFNLIGAAWAPAVPAPANLLISATATGAPRVAYTPNMDAVAITYTATGASGSTTKIFKLTITATSFSEYTLPVKDFNTVLSFATHYLYFDETSAITYLQLSSISTGISQ